MFCAVLHAQTTTTGTTADGLKYTSTSAYVTITGYSGTGGALVIPPSINGGRVLLINGNAFVNGTSITSVAIPYSVVAMTGAFAYCPNLISITVDAQNSCYTSVDGILFDKSKTILHQFPPGKTDSTYTIPDSVTGIVGLAFNHCTKLTSVTIPNSVTSIWIYAFYAYTCLTTITIPSSVTVIGDAAFKACPKLNNAIFMGNAPTMGTGVFDSTASGFELDYYNGATGFASPTWNGYKAVNIGAPPLASWPLFNGFPQNADLKSDPKNCGVSLLMAYGLNLDPTRDQSSSLPRPIVAADQMSLTFYAGSEGVIYSVESSTDLLTWDTADVTISAPDTNNFRTATVPATGPRRFLRLVVTR